MESAAQKLAVSKSIQAEEKKVTAKKTVSITKKQLPKKTKPAKSRVTVTPTKKPLATKGQAKKVSREKIIRDSFTMPVDDYNILSELKKKCLSKGIEVKKSELLRAGLKSLTQMNISTLKKQLSGLSEIKTGRPPKQ